VQLIGLANSIVKQLVVDLLKDLAVGCDKPVASRVEPGSEHGAREMHRLVRAKVGPASP